MEKIKRNDVVEKGIMLAKILPRTNGMTIAEFMDKVEQKYKENCGVRYTFTAEEADRIMKALKSMPGYSAEKILAYGGAIIKEGTSTDSFCWQLYIAYIFLDIMHPELFEDYEGEEEDGKTDSEC